MTRGVVDVPVSLTPTVEVGSLAPGLAGPYSMATPTESDPRIQDQLRELLLRAREIRPLLRERQAQTEADGQYASDVHEFFLEHGFYRMLMPLAYGGFELSISAFYLVVAEVARGCPSTAWCLSLSSGHSLTLGSYWPEAAQTEIFGRHGYMIAPASGNGRDVVVEKVDGGYLISGSWRYASGAPYSTHFMPMVAVSDPDSDAEPERYWTVLPRESYTILDDWGRIIGMRGSGSNGITADRVFVPDHMMVKQDWTLELTGGTVGSRLHGNPMYAGTFVAFAEGEVAASSVGLGYAACDEYERIITTTKHPRMSDGSLRAAHADWQRNLGMAMGKVDAAAAILTQSAKLYSAYAARSVDHDESFDAARTMRLSNTYFVVEQLIWEAVEMLFRTAGSTAAADGQTLQRYFRDIVATRTRTDQFEFAAAAVIPAHFAGERKSGAE